MGSWKIIWVLAFLVAIVPATALAQMPKSEGMWFENWLHDPNSWIAVAAFLIAVLSAFYARSQAVTAKISLKLAEHQEARRRPDMVPVLLDSCSLRSREDRVLAFSMSVANRSDADDAISRLELEIKYQTASGTVCSVRIPHDSSLSLSMSGRQVSPIELPAMISAHCTIAGWAIFRLVRELFEGSRIESYSLRLEDTHGVATTAAVESPREIADERVLAANNKR